MKEADAAAAYLDGTYAEGGHRFRLRVAWLFFSLTVIDGTRI